MAFQEVIYQTLIDQKIPTTLAKIVTAQSQFESGNYTSNVFKTDNNAFGYKYVGQKIATRGLPSPASEGDNYAHYNNVADSAKEIANWLKRRLKEKKLPAFDQITSPSQYSKLIKQAGYYGANENTYTKGLNRYFEALKIGGSSIAIIFVMIGLFFLVKNKIK